MSMIKEAVMPKDGKRNDPNDFRDDKEFKQKLKPLPDPFDLNAYALNGESDAMIEKMLADKFVLGEIALLGDGTIISAKPNAGKTLLTIKLLIDGINSKEVDLDIPHPSGH